VDCADYEGVSRLGGSGKTRARPGPSRSPVNSSAFPAWRTREHQGKSVLISLVSLSVACAKSARDYQVLQNAAAREMSTGLLER
jgi:hypothetical protein